MTYDRDFASKFIQDWRAGGHPLKDMPAIAGTTVYTISHDAKTMAYRIEPDELNDFLEWVVLNFNNDYDFELDMISDVWEYLEEIDVDVREYTA
jgi:hypothetical protein